MKKLLSILSLCSLILLSCSKEKDEGNSTTSAYTAMVDGVVWKSAVTDASISNGNIVVIGKSSNGSLITFSLSGDTIGVYAISENTSSSATFQLNSTSAPFSSGASSSAGGQISIESINTTAKTMSGSIDFFAVRASDDSAIVISGGKFVNIRYGAIPIGIGDNMLKAKVNGSNWAPQNVSGFVAFKSLYLQATDADGIRKLTFELPEMIGPGKYELNFFDDYKGQYTGINEKLHYASNGTLEIVSHNLVKREIEAKFDMVAVAYEGGGKAKFTEGEFLITYE